MAVVESGQRLPTSTSPMSSVADRPDSSPARQRDWILTGVLVVTDAVMIAFALYTAWAIRYVAEIGPEIEETNYVPFSVFAPLLLGLIPATWLTFATGGLYRQRRGTEWF